MTAKEALVQSARNHKRIRESKGYAIAALAVLSGVDAATIEALEAGDFDFPYTVMYELAAALNVDFQDILVDPTAPGNAY
jgi:transcriptional regulator with XRE-family HTH domain